MGRGGWWRLCEAEHNYQDVSANTKMLSIQPSGHLNQRPFRNEQSGEKVAELVREWVFLLSFLNKHWKPTFWGHSRKTSEWKEGKHSEPMSLSLSVSTSRVTINKSHESQWKFTASLETQQRSHRCVPSPVPMRKSNLGESIPATEMQMVHSSLPSWKGGPPRLATDGHSSLVSRSHPQGWLPLDPQSWKPDAARCPCAWF